MNIRINGKSEPAGKPLNLMDLVLSRGLVPGHVVLEHNLRIVPRDEWQDIALKEGDNIEIVSFVGGG